MDQAAGKIDIRGLDEVELEGILTGQLSQPRFRTGQIWKWIWQKGATTFEEMTDLSKELRNQLPMIFAINAIQLDKMQTSLDGTIKSRFRLFDGHLIESVLIPVPVEKRYTVCVSSQVGCSLTCRFCATGQMKRVRNLEAPEIFDQVFQVNQQCLEAFGHPLTNIVYMGMGEPLLAYKPVISSVARITAPDGLNMSPRRITVSTAGIEKMIKKLADDQVKFNLALSLHAADDEKRNQLMPINEQNSLAALQEALIYFYAQTHNRITLEYIAFNEFNDFMVDAYNLARFCRAFPVMVNIIEYNPIDGFDLIKSTPSRIDAFASRLSAQGVSVTVRRSRGKDIDAACGQLANKG
ncbi:MAG: 23S rRNA (adenine(2503)-C(2))-methyltransferase RlmN [Saprospiraceae bacterium]|nr:23S rRNA (adenine(2503)-C(2))-methyltransferase RlmN [Saprospiraceae bacterium]